MATMAMTSYVDRITGEKILEIESSRTRKEIIERMLVGVESEMVGYFEAMRKYGWLTEEDYAKKREHECNVVDLVSNCCLMELDDFSEVDLEEYLEGYMERLKPLLNSEELTFIEMNIGEVKDYLIPRIRVSHLKAYTTLASFGDTNASTEGSIAFADTMGKDQPPTFLYLAFGLLEYHCPATRSQEENNKLLYWAQSFSRNADADGANTAYISSEDDNICMQF